MPGDSQPSAAPMHTVLERANQIILGKESEVRLALTCLLAGGHLLLEDLPGMGKTDRKSVV